MSAQNIMNKIRYWDNLMAQWILRHFYMVFFELVLVILFFLYFFNVLKGFEVAQTIDPSQAQAQLMILHLRNNQVITMLLILNSFWMLFMFNAITRMRFLLKDLTYRMGRQRRRHPSSENSR